MSDKIIILINIGSYLMQLRSSLAALLLLTVSFSTYAVDDKIKTAITNSLERLLAESIEITSISETPITNVYQVIIGPEYIYITGDGKYFLQGELIDVVNRTNITESARTDMRQQEIENIDQASLIAFDSPQQKNSIYVFTDIDCGYCRKLHNDIPALNQAGVSVKYLAYPRAGAGSNTWNEMAEVWCAKDKSKAITDAKQGDRSELGKGSSVEELQACNELVHDQYDLGKKMGVRGTPAIYLENGYPVKGYLPPDTLIELIMSEG